MCVVERELYDYLREQDVIEHREESAWEEFSLHWRIDEIPPEARKELFSLVYDPKEGNDWDQVFDNWQVDQC